MDALIEGCQIIGFDWRFLYINDSAASQGRKSKSEFLGLTMQEVLPGIENTEMFALLKRVMDNRIPENMENEFTYFDGLKGWFELRVQPCVEGIFILSLDITQRKRAEEALIRSEAELRKAQRLESIGLLAGGIAHDFNNLMGGIFGYLDLARNESDRMKSSGYLTKAVETIERARGLTQNLLTFSKGGAPIKKAQPLFPLIEDTVQAALIGTTITCKIILGDNLWSCNIDKVQIAQVIDNLIINARQAVPKSGVIEVTANNKIMREKEHARLEAGRYVLISVKDNGMGIDKDILPKIFDPFFTTKSMGHGLGLATCYSIVVRHGGAIDVESDPGKLTVFNVYLPAMDG
jgi:signal transduction histidine kinase